MSATIRRFGMVNQLDEIKVSLVPESKTKQELLTDDDWDNRWNWDTNELVLEDESASKKHLWLADCKIALSPFTDVLVIGKEKNLSIFHLKHSGDDADGVFVPAYTTSLQGLETDEELTGIALLPFVSQQRSGVNHRDWTAIVGGFSSGYFRIYAENGKLLMSHLFHDEPVLDIKCRTYSANSLLAEQLDEIVIVYPTAVIQIDGFALYQTLRMCRQQLARSSGLESSFLQESPSEDHTPFTFKKWSFETPSDGKIYDCVNVCSFVRNDFDALVSHSIDGKPLINDTANLFLTTGTNPYIGFHRAQEGTTHTIIDELSQALFNKVKNVFSFFSQAKQKEIDPRERIKPATSVPCSLAMFDERLGFKIVLSPNRRLAAVVDDFGRVILFDTQNQIAVRIWKGYRRAEVGWVVVEDNSAGSKESSKKAHFLVIYAPKRGILEVWCAQNGPRVTAFNVGKNCRLLYTEHTMCGLNFLILENIKHTMPQHEFNQIFTNSRCFLFNFETDEVLHINVPFLCALTDRNSRKTRDIHILKDLKMLLKKHNENLEGEKQEKYYQEVSVLVLMLKTAEIRRECLELIKSSNDARFIHHCTQVILDELLRLAEKDELDFENKLVGQMCARIIQLCQFYLQIKSSICDLARQMAELETESENPPDIHQLIDQLGGWSGNDVARILSLLAFRQSVLKSRSSSGKDQVNFDLSIIEMLSHFTLYYNHLVKRNNVEIYQHLPIEIILMNGDGNYIELNLLASFLFNATFCGDTTNLERLLSEVCVFPSNLLLLLFTAWLHSPSSQYWPCWETFSSALFKIVNVINDGHAREENSDGNLEGFDDSQLAPSWADIITLIYKSQNITSAFVSVHMIKALINKLRLIGKDLCELGSGSEPETNKEVSAKAEVMSTNSVHSADNEWETLHLDKENLSLLIKQLEDLFLLDMLLKSNCCTLGTEIENEDTLAKSSQLSAISLSFMLTSGPGIVSEIVARWAIQHRIEPDLLVCSPAMDATLLNEDQGNTSSLQSTVESSSSAEAEMTALSERSTLMEILDHVRRCFPNCLESDILLINCAWEILLQWHHQPLIMMGELPRALRYLEKVSSSVLKHNVAAMGWRLFILKRFEVLCNLIEKMGKKPKDRISRKELGMDENNLEQFVSFCCDLLDFMVQTSFSSETEPLPLYIVDDWWCGFNASSQMGTHYAGDEDHAQETSWTHSSPLGQGNAQTVELGSSNTPLALMAIHQKAPNLALLFEYHHLAVCLQFVVYFCLRSVRPMSLFPSSVRAYFFKDLYSFLDSDSIPSDPVLIESREKFLSLTISATVQTLPVYRDEKDREGAREYYRTANKWFNKVLQLAREWNLNLDHIRQCYVCDLFLYGCDPLADELMSTVSDVKSLSRKLLVIAGQRMLHILLARFTTLDEVSFLPPNILFWLKSLVTDPNCFGESPHASTQLLLEKISHHIYDDLINSRIAEELLCALKSSHLQQ